MEHKVTLIKAESESYYMECACGHRSHRKWSKQDILVEAAFHLVVVGEITTVGE